MTINTNRAAIAARRRHMNKRHANTDSARWLRNRGCSVREMGVGYATDVSFDTSRIKTLQHFANEKALRAKT